MKMRRFSTEQIVAILKQAETGLPRDAAASVDTAQAQYTGSAN